MNSMMKRLTASLMAVAVTLTLTPSSASAAAKKVYVPTTANVTQTAAGKTYNFTITHTFNAKGKITKSVENWPAEKWTSTKTFKWNKNLVTSISTATTGQGTTKETHTFKSGRETRYLVVKGDGSRYDTTYSWGKDGKTAMITQDVKKADGKTYVITGNRTVDKSKRITSETFLINKKSSKVTYKYYKTGVRKSSVGSGNLNVNGYIEKNISYNKNGYMTSAKFTSPDGKVRKTVLKYTMDKKKKCPKKIVKTETYDGITTTTTYKFTKFKKVKAVRNCDNSGNLVPLGANY